MRGMKSAAAAALVLLCACCRGEEVKVTPVTQVSGSIVTLFADVSVRATEINWLKNDIKVVDLEEGKEPDFYTFYNIQDRVTVNLAEKTFILRDVTPGDSGQYKAVLLVDGKFQNAFFSLRVLDAVCEVSVKNMTVMNIIEGSSVTLRCSCSSAGAEPSQYKWRNVSHDVSDQQNIIVSVKKEQQIFRCDASNEVSNSTANFTVPEIPDKSVIIATAVLVPIILATIIGLFVLYKRGHLDWILQSCRRQTPKDPEQNLEERKRLKPGEEPGVQNNAENGEETKKQKNGKVEDEDAAELPKDTNPPDI